MIYFTFHTQGFSLQAPDPPESADCIFLALFILPFLQTSFTFQFICFGTDVSLDGPWFSTWFSPLASVLQITLGTDPAHSYIYPSNQNPSPMNSLAPQPRRFVLEGIQKVTLLTDLFLLWRSIHGRNQKIVFIAHDSIRSSGAHSFFWEGVAYGAELADLGVRELGFPVPLHRLWLVMS